MDEIIAYVIIIFFYLIVSIIKRFYEGIFNKTSPQDDTSDDIKIENLLDFLKKHKVATKSESKVKDESQQNAYSKYDSRSESSKPYSSSVKNNKSHLNKYNTSKKRYVSKHAESGTITSTTLQNTEHLASNYVDSSSKTYIGTSTYDHNTEIDPYTQINYDQSESLDGKVNLEASNHSLECEPSLDSISSDTRSLVSPLSSAKNDSLHKQLSKKRMLKLKLSKQDVLKSIILSEILKPYKLSNALKILPFNKSDSIL